MRITSRANPRIQELRQLAQRKGREATGLFAVEGTRLVQEAVTLARQISLFIYTPELLSAEDLHWVVATLHRTAAASIQTTPEIMGLAFTRRDPPGVAALVRQRWENLTEVRLGEETCWIALSEVQHPGSLGTVLRICDSVGGAGVILIGPSTDPHDPTAVRSSLGAVLSQRLVRTTPAQFQAWRQGRGYPVIGTSPAAGVDYARYRYPHPLVLLMGGERSGLPAELQAGCDEVVSIPMAGRVESHHLTVATALVAYEVLNQRRLAPGERGQGLASWGSDAGDAR